MPPDVRACHDARAACFVPQGTIEQSTADEDGAPTFELPASLETLVGLHDSFVRAMSLHFAHNGMSAPANLTTLLQSITRLWKKREVHKQDVRKILALSELDPGSFDSTGRDGGIVEHRKGAFTLIQSGLGIQHLLVEYTGNVQTQKSTTSFNEKQLHSEYSEHLHNLWIQCQNDETAIKVLQEYNSLPQLSIKQGAQQATWHEKAQHLRKSILTPTKQGLSTPAPSAAVTSSSEAQSAPSAPVRKQSLLDRLLLKQSLAHQSGPPPTPHEIALHRAKSRLPELADILFAIQKQRTRNQAIPRISFQFNQLLQNIRDSVRVPISEEEIKLGLDVLARADVAGDWIGLRRLGGGGKGVDFVVLQGRGVSGMEIKERLGRMGG